MNPSTPSRVRGLLGRYGLYREILVEPFLPEETMVTESKALVLLTDAELDAVAAGANAGAASGAVGLVAVAAGVAAAIDNVDVDVLNNNNIPVNVRVNLLGGSIG